MIQIAIKTLRGRPPTNQVLAEPENQIPQDVPEHWTSRERARKIIEWCSYYGVYKKQIATGIKAKYKNESIERKLENQPDSNISSKTIQNFLKKEEAKIKDQTTKLFEQARILYKLPKNRSYFFIKETDNSQIQITPEGDIVDLADQEVNKVFSIPEANKNNLVDDLIGDLNLCSCLFEPDFAENLEVIVEVYSQVLNEGNDFNQNDHAMKSEFIKKVVNRCLDIFVQNQEKFNELFACQYINEARLRLEEDFKQYVKQLLSNNSQQHDHPDKILDVLNQQQVDGGQGKKNQQLKKIQKKQQQMIQPRVEDVQTENKYIKTFLKDLIGSFLGGFQGDGRQ